MVHERITWAVLVVLLLLGGLLVGRALHATADLPPPAATPGREAGFRAWFWEQRAFDLLTQVGLIFAGALGVAAILPELRDDRAAGPQIGLPPAEPASDPRHDREVSR